MLLFQHRVTFVQEISICVLALQDEFYKQEYIPERETLYRLFCPRRWSFDVQSVSPTNERNHSHLDTAKLPLRKSIVPIYYHKFA